MKKNITNKIFSVSSYETIDIRYKSSRPFTWLPFFRVNNLSIIFIP